MSVFDELTNNKYQEVVFNNWIEWDHFGIPNKPKWLREIMRNIMALFGHCMTCTSLDGCYLVEHIMPKHPLHTNCHCTVKPISYIKFKNVANAVCDIRKFTNYIFIDKNKKTLFEKIGYNINDSAFLKTEICRQALKEYLSGNYILKVLDSNGQRIAIPIRLNGFVFNSGWMLCPEGQISNTTPFGGWTK